MGALWGLTVGRCVQWWISKLLVQNVCLFSRRQQELKYVIRLPQGVNGYQEVVEKFLCLQQPSSFSSIQSLHALLTSQSRLALRVPGSTWVVLGKMTSLNEEELHVTFENVSILGSADLTLSFGQEVTMSLRLQYGLNPVSLKVIHRAREEMAKFATQIEAYIQQLYRGSSLLAPPRWSQTDSSLYIPLSHTILPVEFDHAPTTSVACYSKTVSLCLKPLLFLCVTLPSLLLGLLWWFFHTLYLFLGLTLIHLCWCPAPIPTLKDNEKGWKVRSHTVPWGVRLDVAFWLDSINTVRRAFAFAQKMDAWLTAEGHAKQIEDETLRRLLICSATARVLEYDIDSHTYSVRLGNYEVICEADGTPTRISNDDLSCTAREDAWPLAKARLSACIGSEYLRAYHARNDLMFAQLAACALHTEVKRDAILYYLLAPHLRFVLQLGSPSSIGTFLSDEKAPDGIKGWPYGFVLPFSQTHPTNYDKFLLSYYTVVRKFVVRVYSSIKSERSYPPFMAALARRLPAVLGMSPVDLLTTLIWQVSVVHSADLASFCDHGSFFNFAAEHGASAWDVSSAQHYIATTVKPQNLTCMQLAECNYEFPTVFLRQSELAFRQALKDNDTNLLEHGIQLVPLKNLFYCILS